jgi:hypothetical protein
MWSDVDHAANPEALKMRRPTRVAMAQAVTVVLTVSFLLSGCTRDESRPVDKPLESRWPVKSASIYGDRLSVRLQDGVPLTEAADMSLFGQFRPDQTIEQVSNQSGKPTTSRTDHRGVFYEYAAPKARIEVAHEQSSSGGLGTSSRWTVYAYPKEGLGAVLHPEIERLLREAGGATRTIVVMTTGPQRLWGTVSGATVTDLRWYTVSD